jgi:hypothetical protein
MVAKITIPHSLIETLNYNEKKVQKGSAVCIGEQNCLLDHDKMNFYQKMAQFENRNVLNDRATTKTIHVSLNFDPSENHSVSRLNEIAAIYMDKIGFGEQPCLIYQHHDAGHPHLHIVSTTIRADGTRINTHNIGRNQSETARKEIESAYNLIKAENQQKPVYIIKPVDVEKVQYGKAETKRSITNVLNTVVTKYNYTSLPELNAALKQFNVVADRGAEDGLMFQKKGLVYRVLNNESVPIGVPIKASSINNKPTLQKLEALFEQNKSSRDILKRKLKSSLDETLKQRPPSIAELKKLLLAKQVFTVIRQNTDGRMYGITFVDNKNKAVFNGSELGKQYSISYLQANIAQVPAILSPVEVSGIEKFKDVGKHSTTANISIQKPGQKRTPLIDNKLAKHDSLLEQLMSPKLQFENVPHQLVKKKKRKKKRTQDL